MSDIFTRAGTTFYALMLANSLPGTLISRQYSRYNRLHLFKSAMEHKLGDKYNAHCIESLTLLEAAEKIKPVCVSEHFKSGLKFLNTLLWTPNGNLRKTDKAREFSPSDTQVLCGAKEIAWVGTYDVYKGGFSTVSLPMYEVRDGLRSFTYCASSWQSGGHFEVIDHA